jgi:hypothetical protein
MSLKVIGAGLGRTGTTSLLVALRQLLNKPCYHMSEVFDNKGHPEIWQQATVGKLPDWLKFYHEYGATVDWPSAAFWSELSDVFPDALILLSERDSESWWNSASETIFQLDNIPGADEKKRTMLESLFSNKFTPDYQDKDKAIAAYEKHNQNVKETAPKDRLLIWNATEGWEPICRALDLSVPDTPFPKVNTRQQWQDRINSKSNNDGFYESKTSIEINSAEKYLNRLCKHFNHKVDAEYGDGKGTVDFKFATCQMSAQGDELKIVCQAESAEKMARVKYVIEDHLTRFTWKEEKEIEVLWNDLRQ